MSGFLIAISSGSSVAAVTKQKLYGGFGAQTATGSTNYGPLIGGVASAWETTEANFKQVWPSSGTIRKLRIHADTAPTTGKNYTISVSINGSASALSAVLADTNTDVSDNTHNVSITAGALVTLKCVPSGTPAAIRLTWEFEFQPTTYGETVLGACTTAGVAIPAGTNYGGLVGCVNFGANTLRLVMPCAGTIHGLYVNLATDPTGAGSRTFTVFKNGSGTGAPAITFSSGQSGVLSDTSTNLSVVAGDLVQLQSAVTSSPASSLAGWGLAFTPTTAGDFVIARAANQPSASTVNYVGVGATTLPNATETLVQNIMSSTPTLQAVYMKSSTQPGVGKTLAFALRENAGTPSETFAMSITGGAGNDNASVTGKSFVPTDGDLYDWQITPTTTPTVGPTTLSFLAHIVPA